MTTPSSAMAWPYTDCIARHRSYSSPSMKRHSDFVTTVIPTSFVEFRAKARVNLSTIRYLVLPRPGLRDLHSCCSPACLACDRTQRPRSWRSSILTYPPFSTTCELRIYESAPPGSPWISSARASGPTAMSSMFKEMLSRSVSSCHQTRLMVESIEGHHGPGRFLRRVERFKKAPACFGAHAGPVSASVVCSGVEASVWQRSPGSARKTGARFGEESHGELGDFQ